VILFRQGTTDSSLKIGIVVFGLTFEENTGGMQETPAITVRHVLQQNGCSELYFAAI
jgi:UDP-N-acetyl-D-mannosaminuronate dehydrogenase